MSLITDLVERLRALVFRRREERELDEELRFHVEQEAARHRLTGATDAEARRRGAIALGGVEQVKEEVRDARGTRLLEDSKGDFAYALRTLLRAPGFAVVVILTLAIGIGGTTAVFSAVDAVLLQPLPYEDPGQLVRLYQGQANQPDLRTFVTPVHYLAFREQLGSFDGIAAILTYDAKGADIGSGADVRRIRILPTSADYFDVVRVRPTLGRGFQPDDEHGPDIPDEIEAAPVVVLSHELWERQLHGDPSVVGHTLVMNGKAYTVSGVMPAGFVDPVAGAIDAWVPVNLTQGRDADNVTNHYLTVIGRLRSGVPIERAQAELDAVMSHMGELYPRTRESRARLYPLKDDIVGSSSRALEIMLGAVGLVLLLVCVNIANLMLVRGSERAREFAVRSALGAGRSRLVRQLLIESLTLAIAGALAGLLVARLAMSAIVALGSGTIPRLATLSLDPRLLAFSLAVATVCALLFGLAPAIRAARAQPAAALRDQSRSATGDRRSLHTREWLVASQVALAFVLLVGAGLLLASFRQIRAVELGIASDHVLTFQLNLPAARYDSTARARFYEEFAAQVATLPGVKAAGGISRLPATGAYHQWGVTATSGPLAGDDKRNSVGGENRVVSGEYFKAVGMRVVAGRTFDPRDIAGAPDRVVISKSLAERLYPGSPAVGQTLNTGGRQSEIIGVVNDVAVDNEGQPDMYVYHAHRQFAGDRNWALAQVIATAGAPEALETPVRRALAELDPQLVMFRPATLDEAIGAGAAQRVFTLRILLTFAGVALALSALGLFGVLSYSVKLRSREFGIRLALGADRRMIGAMVLRRGLAVAAVGVVVGLAGALAATKLLASVLFHVSPLDPRVLLGAMVFMLLVAAAAAYFPAHRATSVDPRTALQ
jgi:putative ABC transport system permease protein